MKTNHGILEAKSRGLLVGFAVLLMAAIFTFTGCPTDSDDGGDDLPPIDGQTTGITTVTETVKLAAAEGVPNVTGITIEEQTIPFDGEGASYGSWSVTDGELTLELDTPSGDNVNSSADWLEYFGFQFFIDTTGPNAVKAEPATGVNIASTGFFNSSTDDSYYIERSKQETDEKTYMKESSIVYIYVSGDITLSRGKVEISVGTFNAFNLPLKTGWNLVQTDTYANFTTMSATMTIKIANEDVPWTIYPAQ
jgi:hypothetical protein